MHLLTCLTFKFYFTVFFPFVPIAINNSYILIQCGTQHKYYDFWHHATNKNVS